MFKGGWARGRGTEGGDNLGKWVLSQDAKKNKDGRVLCVARVRRLMTLAGEVSEELGLVGEKPACTRLSRHSR